MSAPLRATYRLQLDADFGFREARDLVPYLRELGISHLYLSPSLQARLGSTHGYDVIDPRRVSTELGGEEAFRELAQAGLGVILDIVPNHMAASDENPFWADEDLRRRYFDLDPATGRHRRFFDVDEFAGVRQEDAEVFDTTHAKVLALISEGLVDGIRVDHPDGLANPEQYLRRLRSKGVRRVWVEKILQPEEELRDWPVEGTVGYEFLNDVAALFVDQASEGAFTDLYADLTGERREFWELALEAKAEQVATTFEPEVERLRRLARLRGIEQALARLPVYRTYVDPADREVAEQDRAAIAQAEMDPALRKALLGEAPAPAEFVVRFQQTTPAVAAKGVEDTAFYRYNRLVALNEVGGDPGRFGISVERFHSRNAERAWRFPRGLLTTSTHDAKRSADVRARIVALTAIPARWRERVLRWRELNSSLREGAAPDPNEEYLLYQTLVGAWPIDAERLGAFARKALREAKVNSSWIEPNKEWEARVGRFCDRLLRNRPFLADFEPFAAEVAQAGERIAIGQLLLKLTSPGVPDLYRGEELELLSLVDPDNRRPWDPQRAHDALEELRRSGRPDRRTGRLHVIVNALDLRARRPSAFAGAYISVAAGPTTCAFLRGEEEVLVVVPTGRTSAGALAMPDGTRGNWRELLAGTDVELDRVVALEDVLSPLGVGLLERR